MYKKLMYTILLISSLKGMHEVRNGIDVLVQEGYTCLQGHTIGLITNHTGQDYARNSTIDLLHTAPGVTLKALFSPEHGIRGVTDTTVNNTKDEKTDLPVYSLYRRVDDKYVYTPDTEHLTGLTALVFDIQDIGCRFYTYISTLGHCLEAASKAHLPFFVLDRVNPITDVCEGPVLEGKTAFFGYHTIPVRHGMTAGELACMFNKEKNLAVDLKIVKVQGWKRSLWFDQTGLPWTNPSPNMRSLTEALLYPGIALLEWCPLSVGRGTDTPFEVIGAPYIDDRILTQALQQEQLSGVTFIPVCFKPTASIFKDTLCKGVNIVVLNRDKFSPLDLGITIAKVLSRLYPQAFSLELFNKASGHYAYELLAHTATIKAIHSQESLHAIKELWKKELEQFLIRRKQYLLY